MAHLDSTGFSFERLPGNVRSTYATIEIFDMGETPYRHLVNQPDRFSAEVVERQLSIKLYIFIFICI
jgi:hypothetical protein